MLSNYFKIAIRNILRNKIYATINILGLTMGLVIYIFGNLFADYEVNNLSFSDAKILLQPVLGDSELT